MKFSKYLLLALFSTSHAQDDEDEEGAVAKIGKRCKVSTPTTWGGKDMITICPENYPYNDEKAPKRLWFIFAYKDEVIEKGAKSLKRDSDLAVSTLKDLAKKDKQVGVGRLDCTDQKDFCIKMGFDM